MKTITCYGTILKNNLRFPFNDPDKVANEISDYFRGASSSGENKMGIDLRVDLRERWGWGQIDKNDVTNVSLLHWSLQELTGNSSWAKSVNRIGLVFADYFSGDKYVLGVMFDSDFSGDPLFSGFESYTQVPREGCAVFLDAIKTLRGEGEAYREEVLFTAVHELGHVFNLWHIESPRNFLSSSRSQSDGGVYDREEAFHFDKDHKSFLNQFPDSEDAYYVRPGGSQFGKRGAWPSTDYIAKNVSPTKLNLQFNISMSQTSFWQFEPVELDICIKVGPGETGSFELQNKIDPGYSCFDIWIERPDGVRYKYRSPRMYCQNIGKISITPGKRFERDISIFGQSGGYTFNMAGIHKVWAVLRLPDNTVLSSNDLEVDVKPAMPNSEEYREMRKILGEPRHAKLLYHRSGFFRRRVIVPLEEFCQKTKNKDLTANIHYALGRFLIRHANGKSSDTRRKYTNWGKEHLKAAYDNEKLSPRRRVHTMEYLEL
jgi:hypothetical protein